LKVKSFEKPENKAAELTVEISAEEFEKAVNQAFAKNKGKISIPGFRKGHAPRKMLENMYGENVFYDDAIEILYPQAFDFAYDQEKFQIVGQPGIRDVRYPEAGGAEIVFQFWLYPTIKVEGYKGLSAPKAAVRVLKKDVDDEVERVAERNAREQRVDREAKNGDIANIDFVGTVGGKTFEGGSAEHYDLKLGSGMFIPGFEDQVVGLKAGEKRELHVTFPEQYTEDLAGKDAVFTVTVNEVKERIKPEIDDEFAKDVSEFDTLEEYKNSVKEKLTEDRKAAAQEQFENDILEKVTGLVEGFIPEVMYDERVETMINNYDYRLQEQGLNVTSYLEMLGMTMDQFANNLHPTAVRDVKLDLAFEAIARQENITVTDEEVTAEFDRLAELYGTKAEDLRKSLGDDAARRQLTIKKAHELVIDAAVVEKKAAKKDEDKEDGKEEKKED